MEYLLNCELYEGCIYHVQILCTILAFCVGILFTCKAQLKQGSSLSRKHSASVLAYT